MIVTKKSVIKQLISERLNISADTFIMPDGNIVPVGSDKHKAFLEQTLDSLIHIRKWLPKARRGGYYAASRKEFGDVIRRIRSELRRIEQEQAVNECCILLREADKNELPDVSVIKNDSCRAIVSVWNKGASTKSIAEAMKTTPSTIRAIITRIRKCYGDDIVLRRKSTRNNINSEKFITSAVIQEADAQDRRVQVTELMQRWINKFSDSFAAALEKKYSNISSIALELFNQVESISIHIDEKTTSMAHAPTGAHGRWIIKWYHNAPEYIFVISSKYVFSSSTLTSLYITNYYCQLPQKRYEYIFKLTIEDFKNAINIANDYNEFIVLARQLKHLS